MCFAGFGVPVGAQSKILGQFLFIYCYQFFTSCFARILNDFCAKYFTEILDKLHLVLDHVDFIMENYINITSKNAPERIVELLRPVKLLVQIYQRLKTEKFSGKLTLEFSDGEICDYSIGRDP